MPRLVIFAIVSLLAAPALAVPDLTGKWEVQSMGADRNVQITIKGKKLVAHRVLWPEFEGETYKLEHLYRGKIKGDQIKGQLLVKEDELPDYEVLRPFTGKVASADSIILDGLPMKRIGGGGVTPDAPTSPDRASPPPSFAQAPAAGGTSPDATAPATGPAAPADTGSDAAASGDDSTSLFANIMGTPGMQQDLFLVSNRITIPNPVVDLTAEGDDLFAAKKYAEALKKYEAAAETANKLHAELLHRMGRCHLKLEAWTDATRLLRRALRLDPDNARLRRDYERAKKQA